MPRRRSPDFEPIKQISPYGAELMSLIRDNRNVIEFANYPNAVRELNTWVMMLNQTLDVLLIGTRVVVPNNLR